MANPTNIVLYSLTTVPLIGGFVADWSTDSSIDQISKLLKRENGNENSPESIQCNLTHLRNFQIASIVRNVISIAAIVTLAACAVLSPLATIVLGVIFLISLSSNVKALIANKNLSEELAPQKS